MRRSTAILRRALAILVAMLIACVALQAQAHRHRVRHAVHEAKRRVRHAKHHARRVVNRQHDQAAPRAHYSHADELVLSPPLMRQLQHNLADGGYLDGPIDARLDSRTRQALAAFQRDYHLDGNGALTRASAEGILGRDAIGSASVATAIR